MKIIYVLIWIIALFAFKNLQAQYKLELEWQKDMERIVSITKSDNDSLLYVAFENFICTVKTSDGSIAKTDTVDGTYNLVMSRDGKTVIAAGNYGVGLLDPQTFKKIYWNAEKASDYLSLRFNKKQNKYVICGSPSLIWIYDVSTKSQFKELNLKYFEIGKKFLTNAILTDDGKYIIYSYFSEILSPYQIRNYLKIMDLNGNIIKEFSEISSTQFTLTNDGKTIIYIMSDVIHFFDLITMKEQEGIKLENSNPTTIEMSSDSKFMLLGFDQNSGNFANSLIYCDLETKKYYVLNDNTSWRKFKIKNDNSNLFLGISNTLAKFSLTPIASINDVKNKHDFKVQLLNNDLILTSQSEINPTNNFQIISSDGKLQRNILASEIQHIANGVKIDISTLSSGAYFLQIQDGNSLVTTLKFLKVD